MMASRCCCGSCVRGVTPGAGCPAAGTVLSTTPSPQTAAAILVPRPQFCNLGRGVSTDFLGFDNS